MAAPQPTRRGPLAGLRVLELAGIGPGPFCAMLLAGPVPAPLIPSASC